MNLSLKNISYRVGDFVILDRVTADIRDGEIIGLIGANGAGKSTLANVISGLLRPTSGEINLDGNVLKSCKPSDIGRGTVSRMFQGQHLAWNLTVLDNVLTGIDSQTKLDWAGAVFQTANARLTETEKTDRANESLIRVGLAEQTHQYARDLSFGQQRLLGLARCLVHHASLMLLDEPFTGLKKAALDLTLELLKEESERGCMILIIDHRLSAIESIAKKLWFMERGHLTTFLNFESLIQSEAFVRSYLGFNSQTITSSSVDVQINGPVHRRDPALNLEQSATDPTARRRCSGSSKSSSSFNPAPALQLKCLSGGYGSRTIIDDLSLELSRGEVFCVLGVNGSGKSTLLRLIAGVAKLSSGSISLDGQRIDTLRADQRARKGVRLLPQDHRLFRNLSVSENLILAAPKDDTVCARIGLPLASRLTGSAGYLRDIDQGQPCGPIHYHDRPAGTLSGGEQSKVALQHLEYGVSKVLLLDEPTSGIDGIQKSELIKLVKSWIATEVVVLIAEHDVDFVLAVATRIGILTGGRLTELPSISSVTPDILLCLPQDPSNEQEVSPNDRNRSFTRSG